MILTLFYITPIAIFVAVQLFADNRTKKLNIFLVSSFYVLFLVFKPYGWSPDDFNYRNIVAAGCVDPSCETFTRDIVWLNVVTIFHSFGVFSLITVWAATSLAIKLFIIQKVSINNNFGVYIYLLTGMHLFDFTQYRAGFALTFCFLFLYFAESRRWFFSLASYGVGLGSHLQSLLIFFGLIPFERVRMLFPYLLLLSFLGFQFNFISLFNDLPGSVFSDIIFISKYFDALEAGKYSEQGEISFAYLGYVLIFFLIRNAYLKPSFLVNSSFSIGFFGILFYPLFFFLPVLSNRVLDFCFMFFCLTIGQINLSAVKKILIFGICVLLFVRAHYLSNFFTHDDFLP